MKKQSLLKPLQLFMFVTLLFSCQCALFGQDVIGQWATIDDETGEKKSLVNIYEENGKLYGQIIKLYKGTPDDVCNCSGDKAGQKIQGMIIIDGLTQDGKYWEGDNAIFDPEKDTYYDVKIWTEGEQLMVRGYVGIFHRTQTWQKVNNTSE